MMVHNITTSVGWTKLLMNTSCFVLSFSLMLLITCGCSTVPATDYGKLGLVDVSGTITLDGQPLADAVVTFEDPASGQFSFGRTDSSGAYEMQLDSEMWGVVPGEKLVRISTTRKILGLNSDEEGGSEEGEEGPAAPRAEEAVPEKYNTKSELRVTVSESESTFDFDLKS